MSAIRVLIVEDSPVAAALLQAIVESDPRLCLVGLAGDAESALAQVRRLKPDVISMDIHLPGRDGLSLTRQIMQEQPTPIVIVSGQLQREASLSFEALKAGALTVLEKPVGPLHPDFAQQARQLCTQLAIMSAVRVIRQRRSLKGLPSPAAPLAAPAAALQSKNFRLLGVVASTGGPRALSTLLNGLGADFPLPILVVQHIPGSFFEGFIHWLSTVVPQPVCAARDGLAPEKGVVYVAPPDQHLRYQAGQLQLAPGEPVSYQCPSGTVLFESLASSLPRQSMGVILTGMGNDGAAGLLQLHRAGGLTLAEAESTAVVYGMPAAAARLGALHAELPLEALAPYLLRQLRED